MCALALGVTLAACDSPARHPRTHQVEIRGMQFVPAELTVGAGDTVVWTNRDVMPHTVTADRAAAVAFDSQQIASQATWRYEAKVAGVYTYTCTYHPTMRATLTVR
jgi:plastocyanin